MRSDVDAIRGLVLAQLVLRLLHTYPIPHAHGAAWEWTAEGLASGCLICRINKMIDVLASFASEEGSSLDFVDD